MASNTETQASALSNFDVEAYREGAIGGIIGAVGIAVWFFIADMLAGQPFFTPSVLGSTVLALLSGAGLGAVQLSPVSASLVLMFSVAHGGTFIVIGAGVARLLKERGRGEGYQIGVMILLTFFIAWFIFMNMIVAGVVMGALNITDILIANLIAIVAMGTYFFKRDQA
ncbi:MAG: hypothetical protein HOC91_03345 [Nitrospinaceae bacterium]|jgi:hypothetical protein|nr:hypothetical protein [Nitrospinaceae bacterium]MBT3435130.1 hypothetical protein [Nitrospinaceae bacterium]MBT3820224.1 hypothetical protein [Nitrospinaceae bacterium]MBT4094782.1 hypothetical protein [Nitrospinaceae bacterium]MBT4429529.1 hypothetical protein [Nitrospinaceae bacterium]